MAIVVPDTAEENLLNALLGNTSNLSSVTYRLFTNNITVSESTTLVSFTELSGSLYTPLAVANTDWTVATSSGTTSATRAMYAWAISGSCTVYGYFVTNSSNTTLYWAENFASPITFPTGGGTLDFTASVSLD